MTPNLQTRLADAVSRRGGKGFYKHDCPYCHEKGKHRANCVDSPRSLTFVSKPIADNLAWLEEWLRDRPLSSCLYYEPQYLHMGKWRAEWWKSCDRLGYTREHTDETARVLAALEAEAKIGAE